MSRPHWHYFHSEADLTQGLVDASLGLLADQISCRLLLSGGSTPGAFYTALGQAPVDWTKFTIGLVDERWVDETDAGSNASLIRETLGAASNPDPIFIPMKTDHATPHEAADEVDDLYRALCPPSLTILGMGPDSHTASWFAQAPEYDAVCAVDHDRLVAAVTAPNNEITNGYTLRMTITGKMLALSEKSYVIIKGNDKVNLLRQCLSQAADLSPIGRAAAILGDRLHIFALEEKLNA